MKANNNNKGQNDILLDEFDQIIDQLYAKPAGSEMAYSSIDALLLKDNQTKTGVYPIVIGDWVTYFCPTPVLNENEPRRIVKGSKQKRLAALNTRLRWLRNAGYLSAAALLIAVVILGIMPFINKTNEPGKGVISGMVSSGSPELSPGKQIKAGFYDIAPGRVMTIRDGSAQVERNVIGEKGTPDLTLSVTSLKADFNLVGGINFVIKHPYASIRVVGTQFSVDASERGGLLKVSKGIVEIMHKNGQTMKIIGGESANFGESNLQKITGQKRRVERIQKLHFKNGKVILGMVIFEDKKQLKVKTKEGVNIIIDKQDLL